MIRSSFPKPVSDHSSDYVLTTRIRPRRGHRPEFYSATVLISLDKAHGSYHWAFERAMSVALIPLTIAPFAAGSLNPVTDALLAATLIIHSHIGFESCVIDYIPTRKYGAFAKFMGWVLKLATAVVFGNLTRKDVADRIC